MLRAIKIIAIIMTTFYLDGCSSNNDAVNYFDERFKTLEVIINTDNAFQTSLDLLLSDSPDNILIDEQEYLTNLKLIKSRYDSLLNTVNGAYSNKLPVQENDMNLDRAYRACLESYYKVCTGEYLKMMLFLENPDESKERIFRANYQKASEILNEKIDVFYETADRYAAENNIEINWK